MTKARLYSSALDGQTVTLAVEQGSVTVGPNTISFWRQSNETWSGVNPASLTIEAQEILPSAGAFAPYPVEWRIRVSNGTSYATPDWAPAFFEPDDDLAANEAAIRLGIEADDPSYQRCHYVVHTGDSGNYRNDWVGSQAHRNKAYQYGQNCGHVYSDPGTYTGRSVYVYDDEGNWGTAALPDLVVANPDTEFDAASTIVVSPTSDFTGAPAHDAANECTTMDAASARFAAIKSSVTAGVRICVQSGATFNERAGQFASANTNGVCLVDTYGGSAQFIYSERDLDTTAVGDWLFSVDNRPAWAWRIKNGYFDLGYDMENGRPTNPDGWLGGANTHNRNFMRSWFPALIHDSTAGDAPVKGDPAARIVFDNLDITGCGWFTITTLASSEVQGRNVAMFVNECEFYGNPEYAFLNPQNLFALGTKFRSLDGADLGGMGRSMIMGTSRGWTSHPIFLRQTYCWTVYVRACYLESRGGWSGLSSNSAFRGGQPIMRGANQDVNTIQHDATAGWVNARGRRYYFCDSVISGYFSLDGAGDRIVPSTGESASGAHAILENCLLIVDPMSGAREGIVYNYGPRVSIRNNMFLATSEPAYALDSMAGRDADRFDPNDNNFGYFRQFISDDVDNNFKEGGRAENRHNTFAMLRNTASLELGGFSIRGAAQNKTSFDPLNQEMVEGHNVVYAPNLDTPEGVTSVDTIDLPAGMRTLDPWIKFSWESKRFVLAADVAINAETPAIQYPVDWYTNPTTGADYAGSGHTNSLQNEDFTDLRWFEPPADFPNASGRQSVPDTNHGMITVIHDCDAAGVFQGDGSGTHFKIVNRSGETWIAGNYRAILDRGSTSMTPETPATAGTALQAVDQTELKLYQPTTPQALDDRLGSTLFDFHRNLRPKAGYAISPISGVNAAGAILSGI